MDDSMQQAQQVPSDDQMDEQASAPAPDSTVAPEATTVEPESTTSQNDGPPPPPAYSENTNQSDGAQQYDEEIKSDKIETKRKTFFMDFKANNMGRYIKISERSSGKRSTIIIPEENIQEFIEKIQGLLS